LYNSSKVLDVDSARVCVVAMDATDAIDLGSSQRWVLLLHGNPSCLEHFWPIMPALLARAGVIAYDHPGFGRSTDFSTGDVTLERSAGLAALVLDALGVTAPVDVIGHSHGGLVAVAMAALAPARVRSVAVIGTGAAPAPAGYHLLRAIPGLASMLPAMAGAPLLGAALLGAGARTSFAPDRAPPGFLGVRPEALGPMVRLARDDPGAKATAYARQVRVPALVIHGTHDAIVSIRHGRRLSATLPSARFVAVAGGHMVHIAHPERVVPLLDEWLVGR
jgi:pimeloyl-ACP methyl ester carboxylesterase